MKFAVFAKKRQTIDAESGKARDFYTFLTTLVNKTTGEPLTVQMKFREACGAPETFLGCIDNAAFAANIILIGNGKRETTFNHSILLKKELNVHGSRNALKDDFINNIDLVATGKADVMKMVSGVYDMADALDAFKALANNDGTLAKLLIKIGD